MRFSYIGSGAAFVCAITYLMGFAFLVTILAQLGFGTNEINIPAVIQFIADDPLVLIAFNTIIYVVNALALALLVVALYSRLSPKVPEFAVFSLTLGTMWATLVLGAGMVANVTVERVHALALNPEAAAELWNIMHAVELGLGGGNEIAGGAWILIVSLASFSARIFSPFSKFLGAITGFSGFITIIPIFGEIAGVIFGLGGIVWFIAMGVELLRAPNAS